MNYEITQARQLLLEALAIHYADERLYADEMHPSQILADRSHMRRYFRIVVATPVDDLLRGLPGTKKMISGTIVDSLDMSRATFRAFFTIVRDRLRVLARNNFGAIEHDATIKEINL